jgi:tetratricopeptide (TPR) repeat protein
MNRFIRELRRREVFRTAGLYIGVCWILIEASSVLLPTFEAPEWILRWIIIAAIVGFPIMLVLAWVYDVTAHGIEVQADATDTIVAPLGSRKTDFVVIGVLAVALTFSVYMNITSGPAVVGEPDPVSVLIADFDNQTGNPLFDGLLEQALNIGVEGAPNVTSFPRNNALQVGAIIQPGAEALAPELAQLVAVREGIQYVLSGLISPDGSGFEIVLSALDPGTGEEAFDVSVDASGPEAVLTAVGELSEGIREELGDTTLDQPDATASPFTAASLEAAKAFTEAIDLDYEGRSGEAVEKFALAIELDPNFGRAYAGWAFSEFRLGNTERAEELWNKALSLMETMTERERLRTLGVYYAAVTRNYESAVQSFSELVEKYPADAAARNNLAVSAFLSLDFATAAEQGREIMQIYPNSQLYQSNFSLYAMYSGDFAASAEVAQKLAAASPEYGTTYLPLAVSHIMNGDFDSARMAYREMAKATSSDHRESTSALGLADLEAYLGNFAAAREILQPAIDAELEAERLNAAATKQIALAQVLLAAGETGAAERAADDAREWSNLESVDVAAARIYLVTGKTEAAAAIADELAGKLQSQSRAYGRMIRGMLARDAGNYIEAVDALRNALELADLWLVRFELGRAYLDAEFYAEALGEFNANLDRRGEATAVFLDDTPSVRYLAELPYWIGRAQSGLGMHTSSIQGYEDFLALRPEGGPLADDARQRMQ